MATLKDYWNTTATPTTLGIDQGYPEGMTFTATSSYSASEVKVLMYRTGTVGNVTLSIHERNVDGTPKTPSLATKTIDGNTITTDEAGAWIDFTFDVVATIVSGTSYMIEISNTIGYSVLYWVADGDLGYMGGEDWYYAGGGSGWVEGDYGDALFEVYTVVGTVYDEGTKIVSGAGTAVLEREATGSILGGWPYSRWSDYDATLIWDEDTGTWIAVNSSGGSRYQTNLVVIGQNSIGEGVIYYG